MRFINWLLENTVVRFFEWADYRVSRLLFGFLCLGIVCLTYNRVLWYFLGPEISAIVCSLTSIVISFLGFLATIASI